MKRYRVSVPLSLAASAILGALLFSSQALEPEFAPKINTSRVTRKA